MSDPWSLSDQDLDRLLAGKAPNGGDPVDRELAAFVRDVRAAFLAEPAAETERRHLAAALEVSRLTADKGDPGVRPASKAHRPGRRASGLPKWRRRTVLSSLFASLFAKIAAVAIAAAAATGGLAAAGALPAPAQQAISHAASTVGIHVPSPDHTSPASGPSAHSPSPAPTSTVAEGKAEPEPKSTEDADDADVSETASDANHGACVSYAASIADSLGMTGSLKGQFISALAKDSSALSAKVSDGGKPDAACQAAIDKAKAAASSPGKSDDGASHGKPSVTATATAGAGDHPDATDHPGATDHPDATDHPGATSSPGTGSNPTGVSPTNHPGKP